VPRRLISLLLATVVLAACGTTDSAATVNDTEILRADLEQTVTDFVTIGEAQSDNGVTRVKHCGDHHLAIVHRPTLDRDHNIGVKRLGEV